MSRLRQFSILILRLCVGAFLLSLCGCSGSSTATTTTTQAAQVLGSIDGIFGQPGAQYIQGWACEFNNPNPLMVQIYTGGGSGVGQLYSAYLAGASAGDPGASSSCGTTTGHRFLINISGDLFSRAGQEIFIYGIAPSGGSGSQLGGSGSYSIPAPTTSGLLNSINTSGYASGWALDASNTGAAINVAVYADGDSLMGAETGTLVWQGPANQAASGATGNHGFSVQLPSWVTQGVHSLSAHAVNVEGTVDAPLAESPTVPGGRDLASNFSFSTSASGFPSQWFGYNLPAGQLNLVGLSGTVSLQNTANIYSEILFVVTYLPSGSCPTAGTNASNGPPGVGPTVWSDIIKAPTAGKFSAPVSFTLPVGIPISNCLVVGLQGGTVAGPHEVTGTVKLVATYTHSPNNSTQILGMDSEFCFGQNWGCEAATTDDTQSFAAVTQVTQRSSLNAIWGNISDSTFDGSSSFGPLPTGPWIATNDIYVYHESDCSQFAAGRSLNGPGDYYSQIPQDATHLLSAPLSGNGGAGEGETINYLLPGRTNGVDIYQTFSNVTLNSGDCVVSLYGLQDTTGAFDNEDQLRAIVTPF